MTNHACTPEDKNVGATRGMFNGTDVGYSANFSPVIARRAEMASVLVVALRDIKAGEEIMQDYRDFRDLRDAEHEEFLDVNMCQQGVGFVKVETN
mmetsp:Transcript_14399/g.14594  ORF Transcript_14399/g.14594 Transcript_14399/m.14594 type:complete len:95 (-) Transcript_14399:312-596(-)